MTIFSGTSGSGYLNFGDSGGAIQGGISYDHNTDIQWFRSNNGWAASLNGTIFSVGADESANGSMTTGVNINQFAADNEIFALKSSDVAHGVTHADGGGQETDTYFTIKKTGAAYGGALLRGITEGGVPVEIRGVGTAIDDSDNSSSEGCITIRAELKNGTTVTNIGADINLIAFRDLTSTRVLFKGDGDVHAQNTTWATSLDTEDDMMALRMFDKAASTKGIIASAWDSMIGTDWEYLQKIGVAGSNHPDTGKPDMFSIQGIQKLTMGATWYLGQNFMAFLETMEKRMPGIRKEFEDHMLEQSGRPAMLTQATN